MSAQLTALYRAAIAADEAFSRELVRAYGAANASAARYRRTHAHPAVNAAARSKVAADAAWLNGVKASPTHAAIAATEAEPNRVPVTEQLVFDLAQAGMRLAALVEDGWFHTVSGDFGRTRKVWVTNLGNAGGQP